MAFKAPSAEFARLAWSKTLLKVAPIANDQRSFLEVRGKNEQRGCPSRRGFRSRVVRLLVLFGLRNSLLSQSRPYASV